MRNKLIFIAAWPLLAAATYFFGANLLASLDADLAQNVTSSRKWLIIITTLYLINFVVAWFHRSSWPVNMGRMLVFGLIAYLSMSNLIDLIGDNREAIWDLFSANPVAPADQVDSLRYSCVLWSLCLLMSVVCVGIGFEKDAARDGGDDEER